MKMPDCWAERKPTPHAMVARGVFAHFKAELSPGGFLGRARIRNARGRLRLGPSPRRGVLPAALSRLAGQDPAQS